MNSDATGLNINIIQSTTGNPKSKQTQQVDVPVEIPPKP
ncbi:unnamed protein product, partial [Rotaria sp. Silwood2]